MKRSQLVGVSGAARQLQRSEATVRHLADKGVLPSVRDATGRRLFTLSDVKAYQAEQTAKNTERE